MIDYELKAFVGPPALLEAWPRVTPALRPVPLAQGLALLPVVPPMEPAEVWGDLRAAGGPLALIEADWCGNVGSERAVTWRGAARVAHEAIGAALREMGVAGGDLSEVEALGLLRHGSTRGWTAAAVVESLSRESRDVLGGLVRGLTFRDDDRELEGRVRAEAAQRLGARGRAARPALPALRDAMRTDGRGVVVKAAAAALGRVGAEGIPMLLAALDDPTTPDIWPMIFALGLAGAEAAPALPALQRNLRLASVAEVRAACAEVLGRLAPAESAELLAAALHDPAAAVRTRAAEALGRIADLHGPPLAALREAAEDAEPHVRGAAADALHRIESAG